MDDTIVSRDTIRAKGRAAFEAGRGRDEHGMNPGAPAIADWQDGWDSCATAAFTVEMEQLFGTDEALGVSFRPDGCSYLPNGGSACCCTEYAIHIYMNLPGRVQIFGFSNEDNPTSRVAREELHPSGHDFAIVDQRYIVDPWPRLVSGAFKQMVFDLARDAALVLDIYGPRACWERMTVAEEWAQKPQEIAA